jgi:hypothetical protein
LKEAGLTEPTAAVPWLRERKRDRGEEAGQGRGSGTEEAGQRKRDSGKRKRDRSGKRKRDRSAILKRKRDRSAPEVREEAGQVRYC